VIFLGSLRAEIRAASWFAALGEKLTEGDIADARAYGDRLDVGHVKSWPEAEDFLKSPDASLELWDRDEALRRPCSSCSAEAEWRSHRQRSPGQ
jgi:hypothetical protein